MALEKMDDLFGVTELVKNKIDTEHGEAPNDTNKAEDTQIERVDH